MHSKSDGSHGALNNRLGSSASLSILVYCFSSISMTIINKYCVSGRHWNLNFFYLAFQNSVCVLAIIICNAAGWANLSGIERKKAQKWFPMCLLLVAMIYTSTKVLQHFSVPVYTIFKNLTIIVIAYGESMWFGVRVTPFILLSFGLMVLSSLVAAWADIRLALSQPHLVDPSISTAAQVSKLQIGYIWMSLNVLCGGGYVLGIRKLIKKLQFDDWETIYYNNVLIVPVLLACSFLFEDWSSKNVLKNFPAEQRWAQAFAMLYSGVVTLFISYASAWCIRITSSTTYSMVAALNKLPMAVSGLVFFDTPANFGSISAITLGFFSGLMYAGAKVRQADDAKTRLPVQEPKYVPANLQKIA